MNKTRVSKTLGEIALRVNNLQTMSDFYRDVVELEMIREENQFVFFRIADGFEGHTQVLALFDRSATEGYRRPVPSNTTIDHLAFSLSKSDFEREQKRLENSGVPLKFSYHQWVKWQSLYFDDPEGNVVEFVCYDPR